MRLNKNIRNPIFNSVGAPARRISAENELRRSVMANMLWEDEFYEDGQKNADRIADLVKSPAIHPATVLDIIVDARRLAKLRHVPLLMAAAFASRDDVYPANLKADAIYAAVDRADELAEFLAIYWRNGRRPLGHQVKEGLARALRKFDGYQLAKYDRDGAIRLRDVIRLVHPKPADDEQANLWRAVVKGDLKPADTWEHRLSAAGQSEDGVKRTKGQKDVLKKEAFEDMLRQGKMGYLALLRNLRNMGQLGVDYGLISEAILARRGADRVLPFRFIVAATVAPRFAAELDQALLRSLGRKSTFTGRTAVLVDVSGSMFGVPVSEKSVVDRVTAAATLASIIVGDVDLYVFSAQTMKVLRRLGISGVEKIIESPIAGGSTDLGGAVSAVKAQRHNYDRLIVITDDQSYTKPDYSGFRRAYVINVGSYAKGVNYSGEVVYVNGFSENTLRYIAAYEGGGVDDLDDDYEDG